LLRDSAKLLHAYDGSESLKTTHFLKPSFQTGFAREEEEPSMKYLARIFVNPKNTADDCLLSFCSFLKLVLALISV